MPEADSSHAAAPALYRACIKEGATEAPTLFGVALPRATQEMEKATGGDVIERGLLREASQLLRERSQLLWEMFPQQLLAEMSHAIAGERGSALAFDALPLLGEEQVRDNVDVLRAGEALVASTQEPLRELESLLSATGGGPSGLPRRHPLRPEVWVRGLHRTLQKCPAAPSVRRRWLTFLANAMAPELSTLYRTLAHRLRTQGVSPRVAPARAATPEEVVSTQINIRELQRLLAGELEGSGVAQPAFRETEFGATVPAAFETLREMRKVDEVIQHLRQRQAATGSDRSEGRAQMRHALMLQVRRPAQALSLEVVKLMMQNLSGDERLLEPVQEAVRELEPALLRLALDDPRFFSDREHPARQLLEQFTQRSLAWSSVDGPGFAEFFDTFEQAVEALLEERSSGAEAFAIALDAVLDAWAELEPRSRRSRERAVRALLRAEQRNLLAERVAEQLRALPEAQGVPAAVMDFLTGPWAQVMAQARLADADGSDDAGGHGAAATTLLRSVRPQFAARIQPHRDTLAQHFTRGLATIDYPPESTQRWMLQFAGFQERALKATPIAEESGGVHPPRPDTWLAPLEAHDSGFVPDEPGAEATGDRVGGDPLPAVDLQAGAWVDLQGGEVWERWQLTWASPHGLLFLFGNAEGRTQSMTRRRVQHLLAGGQLRLVSGQPVVDGALDAVARAAWRNTAN